MLTGTEVSSLRQGNASLQEAYASEQRGGFFLHNLYIAPCKTAGPHFQHRARRVRKLLLHKREAHRLIGAVQRKGMSLLPLRLYFNGRGLAKLELALAKKRKTVDKREIIRAREWARRKQKLLKNLR